MNNTNTDTNNPIKNETTNAAFYLPFRPHPYRISPDLKAYLNRLRTKTQDMLKDQPGLLAIARTNLQMAKLSLRSQHTESPENTRYWAERSATRSLQLLCWLHTGAPSRDGAPRTSYEAVLRYMEFDFPSTIYLTISCYDMGYAQMCINTATSLLVLARQEMNRTNNKG